MQSNQHQAEIHLTIPFHDIDLMGVAWHGHYARYFEYAREAVLNKIGYGYQAMRDSGYAWPIIDFQVRYRHALRHEQSVRVVACIGNTENHLQINYQIFDAETGKKLTTAYTRQVAIDCSSGEICLVCPEILNEKMAIS